MKFCIFTKKYFISIKINGLKEGRTEDQSMCLFSSTGPWSVLKTLTDDPYGFPQWNVKVKVSGVCLYHCKLKSVHVARYDIKNQ